MWKIGDTRDGVSVIGKMIEVGPGDQDGDCVALVYRKADARLIAAAPDLLRELKAVCESIEPDCGEPDCPDCGPWRASRRAIAKATHG